MLRRLTNLLWLRKQIMMSNKGMLLSLVIPFFLLYFYKFINSRNGSLPEEASIFLTMFCLNFFFNISIGIVISSILTEEKEKGNLRTLILTGVRPLEYILSTLVFPFLHALVLIVAAPLVLELSLSRNFIPYVLITILTALLVMLMYLVLGTFCKNQVNLQVYSFPVMLVCMMLPNLVVLFPAAKWLVDLSFMGLYSKLFYDWQNFSWASSWFQVLAFLVWTALLVYVSIRRVKQLKSLA
ncbi:ABC transporter permease [Streptococcus cuniculipharyngis]|uniref:ABC transporter permease n=1 Tax=Streptococcus cuniculipharyngis TaxID=1562651 RepID=A0A5C5SDA7_9STRE|nr:ABC transporter permease [Streptococcus cuniculipharyngis]TWS98754.1 ABC transporter permease [Streptococcus cuniculipharyngis]